MGEKDDMEKEANEKKAVDAGGKKKVDDDRITVVLKLDLHCDGCGKKVKRSIRYIQGVETVKVDSANNKLTIIGKVDPMHIKERVEYKTKKKVEVISPKPKKDDGGENKADDKLTEAKSNDQKPKEVPPKPQATTVVLKISLHCDGCVQKIKRIILKIDGVESVIADGNKNLVTVKGTMNMNELKPYLKEKLKRDVDIVPPKKEDNKDGEKKDEKKVEGGGEKKEKEGGNDGDDKKKVDVEKPTDSNEGGEKKKDDAGKTTDGSEAGGQKKNDKIEAASGGDENNKSGSEAKPVVGGGGGDGDESKSVDLVNKYEHYRHSPYIYTMPVYNQNYQNQDYDVFVYPSHGYANEGYGNNGYVVEYPHRPPAPPSPMYLHDPRASEMDMLNAENPNACSIM